ncbi:JmjC domain-containing protein [Pendulispora albinea]|uniref:JmjC domain-containing protein n=1 Tax=Pendulispora albinea TaxID=2741071 RepID=A0ABZ2LJP2_9BACT
MTFSSPVPLPEPGSSRGQLLGTPRTPPASSREDPDPVLPKDWWRRFAEMLQDGDRPLHFDRPFGAPLVHPRHVDDLVRTMQKRADKKHVRIYCGGRRRDDLAHELVRARLPDGVPVFDWIRELCKSERMAFVINDVQDWSEVFARAAAPFLTGHFESRGVPPAGAEMVLFAGNYEATPFGAHRGYEHAFLAHLGPANKEFYIWSAELYQQLTGGTADLPNYEHLLPYATAYTLKPGDLLYLPAQWYHIGTQTEYSASVAIPMYQPDRAKYLAELVSEVARTAKHRILPRVSFQETGSAECAAALRREAEELLAGDGLDQILLERWRLHLSNGGLVRRTPTWVEPIALDLESTIARVRPFPILSVPSGKERVRIYARHRSFEIADHPALGRLVTALNEDRVLSVREVVTWFSSAWEESAVLGVLGHLSGMQAIEGVSRAEG